MQTTTTDAGTVVDLRSERVLTGERLDHIAPGSRLRVAPGIVQTPTARDAIRQRKLTLVTTAPDVSSPVTQPLVLRVQSDAAATSLAKRLGWPSELTETDAAIARGRSAICRGESPLVVILTEQPHTVAARLNRQSGVWAFAGDLEAAAAESACFNIICTRVDGAAAFRLPRLLQSLATQAAGGDR